MSTSPKLYDTDGRYHLHRQRYDVDAQGYVLVSVEKYRTISKIRYAQRVAYKLDGAWGDMIDTQDGTHLYDGDEE